MTHDKERRGARAKYLVVTGAIAAGASTLAEALIHRYGWQEILEGDVAVDNPFFGRVYEDPQRWFLASQLHFLNASVKRHELLAAKLELAGPGEVIIEDRTPFEHMAGYTAAYINLRRVSTDEADLLQDIAKHFEQHYIEPDLLVYREMTHDQLITRVRERGRDGEDAADFELLDSIRQSFDAMFGRWDRSAKMAVPATVDVKQSSELDRLAEAIHSAIFP